jgi:hypothetical protein
LNLNENAPSFWADWNVRVASEPSFQPALFVFKLAALQRVPGRRLSANDQQKPIDLKWLCNSSACNRGGGALGKGEAAGILFKGHRARSKIKIWRRIVHLRSPVAFSKLPSRPGAE